VRSFASGRLGLVALWLGGACAHKAPPLHAARLDVKAGEGGVFPLVPVIVAGHPTKLLLDTGASRSVLSSDFARRHGLRAVSNAGDAMMKDSTGRVARMPVLYNVPIQFEGEEAGTLDFIVNDFGGFSGGLLAAGDLMSRGNALVIDLGREELRVEPEETALKHLAEQGVPVRELDYHRCLSEGGTEQRVVTVSINGVRAEMMIDTGASRTVLGSNNPALKSMLFREGYEGKIHAVSSTGRSFVLEGVPIVFSEESFALPVLVNAAPETCGRGMIGSDVLRYCTVVYGSSTLWAACRAPPAVK
jgi:hypothetical protein